MKRYIIQVKLTEDGTWRVFYPAKGSRFMFFANIQLDYWRDYSFYEDTPAMPRPQFRILDTKTGETSRGR